MQNTQNKPRKFCLTSEQLAIFHERGYAGPFTLYQPEEMKELWERERIEMFDRSHAVYKDSDAISGVTNISNYDRHLDLPFLADHICRPEIVDRVSSVLGPDVLCWRTEFFPKYPGNEGTDWHQADTFANASGSPQIVWPDAEDFGGTITVWTAFTEATIENGCLQFIPGTHRTMYYDESKRMHYDMNQINKIKKESVRRGFFGYDYRQLQIDPDWKPDESKSVSLIMRPGQFVMFWSTLMHASHPHSGKTKQMRLGYAARYVPTSVKIYPDTEVVTEYGSSINLEKYGAVLVSGKNDFTYNRIATHTTKGKAFKSN
ncbi:MAG: chlorinating enzyme [Scytonematopsis contorta HA4267-MV1]|jgi:non-heme Fe2+,alpha-ketoglutarate-dependent halogenase|nr:chlorinating enzyme [Scytonematopsis contorta HA4267-MV1]